MDYSEQVAQQIAQYAQGYSHGLPEIYFVWAREHTWPGLVDVFGVDTIPGFYAAAYLEAKSRTGPGTGKILSIGCGEGAEEIALAKELMARGVSGYQITGVELSPILIASMRKTVEEADLSVSSPLRPISIRPRLQTPST